MFMPERLHRQEKLRKLEDNRLRKLGLKMGDESISQVPYLMLSRQRAAAANCTTGAGKVAGVQSKTVLPRQSVDTAL